MNIKIGDEQISLLLWFKLVTVFTISIFVMIFVAIINMAIALKIFYWGFTNSAFVGLLGLFGLIFIWILAYPIVDILTRKIKSIIDNME